MANIKISQLPAKGANLASDDLLEVSEFTGTGYVSKSITGQEIIDAAAGSGVTAVTGNAPIVSTGGITPDISIRQSSSVDDGYLSATDWNTFDGKQDALVSGTNIKTVNSNTLLGSGDIAVQPTLVSGTNIKTINASSVLGSGDIAVQPTLVSGTNIKTVNSTSLVGSGNVAVQPTLVSGTNIKTVNGITILGSGDLVISGGVPTTRTITINGLTQDLSANRNWDAFALVPIQTIASAATVTPTALNQLVVISAQAAALTLAAPTGTPTQGQPLMIRIKDNGTARAIAWTSGTGGYRAIGVTLPTTTVINKTTYVGCIYNSTDLRWDVIGVTTEA